MCFISSAVTAFFVMGGLRGTAIFEMRGANVQVKFGFNIPSAQWKIHELPVDYSIDPKLRCRPEHVGRLLYNGSNDNYIYSVTIASLVMHSMVIVFEGEPVACGTIVPNASGFSYSFAFVDFKSGLFGRLHIVQLPSEHNVGTHILIQ